MVDNLQEDLPGDKLKEVLLAEEIWDSEVDLPGFSVLQGVQEVDLEHAVETEGQRRHLAMLAVQLLVLNQELKKVKIAVEHWDY